MRSLMFRTGPILSAVFVFAIAILGCDKSDSNSSTDTGTAPAKPEVAEQPKPPAQPIIPLTQMADWCPEHGVPESICTRCNATLIAEFKAKGDWDDQHNLPKSQCFVCDPSLKQKFAAAYKEKYGKEPATGSESH